MQIDTTTRSAMIDVLKTKLLASTMLIKFYTNLDAVTPICAVPFGGFTSIAIGDKIGYTFVDSYGNNVFRGAVTASGTVAYFVIHTTDVTPVEIIHGTVGALSTTKDIRFNSINWNTSSNITITDLSIIMLQGA